jgi:serine/threonine protein kinase
MSSILGCGGYCTVFDRGVFAEKEIRSDLSWQKNIDAVKSMRDEAAALSVLSHPNLIKLIAFDQKELRLTLEKMGGIDLFDAIERGSVTNKKDVQRQVTGAVSYVHRNDYVHGDLTTVNIRMIGQVAKIFDLGATVKMGCWTQVNPPAELSSPSQIMGLYSEKPSDIWGLANVFFEMETKQYFAQPNNDIGCHGNRDARQLWYISKRVGGQFTKCVEDSWVNNVPRSVQTMNQKVIQQLHEFSGSNDASKPKVYDPFQGLPSRLVELLKRMFNLDPAGRITADQMLEHSYFATGTKEGF